MTTASPANWHPDPYRRYEFRYWDGRQWTEHVSTQGRQGIDAIPAAAHVQQVDANVLRDVAFAGVPVGTAAGSGTLLDEPVLVVKQRAKLAELNAEYAVLDRNGQRIGAVREIGQNLLKKVVRADQLSSRRLQIVDAAGQLVLSLTYPVAIVRMKVMVRTPDGTAVGEIVQRWASVLGRNKFGLEVGGKEVGSINAEDHDSWDFNIQDTEQNEVARVTKTPNGLAKELFTKADNYVVTVNRKLDDPMRSLVVSAALALDIMLRQQPRRRL